VKEGVKVRGSGCCKNHCNEVMRTRGKEKNRVRAIESDVIKHVRNM